MLYAPDASGNLISTGWLQQNHGATTEGRGTEFSVLRDGHAIITGRENEENLYKVKLLPLSANENIVCLYSGVGKCASLLTWHEQLGHLNFDNVR
jgi:hypothetical protein